MINEIEGKITQYINGNITTTELVNNKCASPVDAWSNFYDICMEMGFKLFDNPRITNMVLTRFSLRKKLEQFLNDSYQKDELCEWAENIIALGVTLEDNHNCDLSRIIHELSVIDAFEYDAKELVKKSLQLLKTCS